MKSSVELGVVEMASAITRRPEMFRLDYFTVGADHNGKKAMLRTLSNRKHKISYSIPVKQSNTKIIVGAMVEPVFVNAKGNLITHGEALDLNAITIIIETLGSNKTLLECGWAFKLLFRLDETGTLE